MCVKGPSIRTVSHAPNMAGYGPPRPQLSYLVRQRSLGLARLATPPTWQGTACHAPNMAVFGPPAPNMASAVQW
jgi:hypothetical protein